MTQLKQDYEGSVKEVEKLRTVEKRVTWSEGRWDRYVQGIKDRSKRIAVDKFGTGPYFVEMQVQLPSSSNPQAGAAIETIKIELAPLDMMPHSVHTFLEQVDSGAWDGTAFDVHAGHVLMARSSQGRQGEVNSRVKQEVPTIMFPEYNAQYPHDKYTIAFPTHPNSSQNSFYINLQYNNAHHSPRIGTSASGKEEYIEGEPCFGKIVDASSKRVVDLMDGLSVEGVSGLMSENVVIRKARIIRS